MPHALRTRRARSDSSSSRTEIAEDMHPSYHEVSYFGGDLVALAQAEVSLRHVRGRQPGVVRSPVVRTTRARLASAWQSCLACCVPERREITPFVGLIERMSVVRGRVGSIDLGRSMSRHEGGERFIEECGVGKAGAQLAGSGEKVSIHSCTHALATHATTMPPSCHAAKASTSEPGAPGRSTAIEVQRSPTGSAWGWLRAGSRTRCGSPCINPRGPPG